MDFFHFFLSFFGGAEGGGKDGQQRRGKRNLILKIL